MAKEAVKFRTRDGVVSFRAKVQPVRTKAQIKKRMQSLNMAPALITRAVAAVDRRGGRKMRFTKAIK